MAPIAQYWPLKHGTMLAAEVMENLVVLGKFETNSLLTLVFYCLDRLYLDCYLQLSVSLN